MSASNQKKLRKEQRQIYMTERQRIEAEEKKKLKIYTATFWIVLALCVCIVLGTVVSNPIKNVVYKNTQAVTIGDHTLNSVQLNYFYIDAVNNYVNQYSSYISYILDTKTPLDEQIADKTTNATWADTFLNMAFENIKSTYALYDLAVDAGHQLTEDEKKSVDTMFTNLDFYATYYGYSSVNAYLRAVYGNGADEDSYRAYYEVSSIADSYYKAHSEELKDSYKDADLRAYEKGKVHEYSSYTFATYYLAANKFYEGGTKDDKGNTTYSAEEKKAGAEKAEKIINAIAAKDFEALKEYLTLPEKEEDLQKLKDAVALNSVEDLNTVVKALAINKGNTVSASEYDDVLYSSVNSLFRDFVTGKVTEEKDEKASESEDKKDEEEEEEEEEEEDKYEERKEGDLTVIAKESGSGDSKVTDGYYIVRFEKVDQNIYNLRNVRHILVQYEGGTYNSTTGTTTYTDAEKKKAKDEAQKLLDQWKAGEKTEDSFADLAEKETDDSGSKANGGLYEDVYPGQMVEPFEDWLYDAERKVGDTGLVESTYGVHIMFYVGEADINYRDYMVKNDLLTEDMEEWHDKLVEAIKLTELNRKYVETDMILG